MKLPVSGLVGAQATLRGTDRLRTRQARLGHRDVFGRRLDSARPASRVDRRELSRGRAEIGAREDQKANGRTSIVKTKSKEARGSEYHTCMSAFTPDEAAACRRLIELALAEDLGTTGDRTSLAHDPRECTWLRPRSSRGRPASSRACRPRRWCATRSIRSLAFTVATR